ncbi:caspase family protein [Capilliphycus salinus ALCB114379]|uniref:caspase family protein n=1 Tax=Capilliphycus salinus TaxID=2768948 RepID=UPI0039A64A48
MGLKRREFLQRASLLLAALGINETQWAFGSARYYQALAQPTRRKLALLVGINQYPGGSGGFEPLRGCITDIELQRELLTCRFGFADSDMITLTNDKATRENIENAFTTHLIAQAKPGDVVVFHFSGYGSYIPRPNSTANSSTGQNALVPVDGTASATEEGEINDLLEDTLWLLLRSLPTHQVITVLDTSYPYPGVSQQGAFRIRSSASPNTSQLSQAELAFQDQLLSQLNISREQLEKRRPNQFPGLVLAATKPSQVAVEINWDNWSAGLFTHTLTQTLWSAFPTDSLQSSLIQVAGVVEQTMGVAQQPQLYKELLPAADPTPTDKPLPFKSLLLNSGAAGGVIKGLEDNGKTAKLLLSGLPASVLEYYEANSLYTVLPDSESDTSPILSQLLIRSRTGLTAKATVRSVGSANSTLPEIKIGQRVKEAIRVLPRQVDLKVALDPKLARIERVDATSAFSGIGDVSIVTNDQPADYILGRVRDTAIAQSPTAPLPSLFQGRYGLFSMGQALLPESVGEGGEAVKIAVQRLIPQLKTRLAAKLFNLTQNDQSSLMKARSTFALLTPQAKVLMSRETPQTQSDSSLPQAELDDSPQTNNSLSSSPSPSVSQGIVSVPVGSRVQYQLQNNGNLPLYFIWFHLNTRGQAYILDPILEEAETENDSENLPRQQRVAPGKIRSLPPNASYESTVSAEMVGQMVRGPAGLAETYLVVSHYPFTQTLKVIEKTNKMGGNNMKFLLLSNPLEVAEAVLEDLSKASQLGVERAGISTDHLALDINAWATFNFIYRVI